MCRGLRDLQRVFCVCVQCVEERDGRESREDDRTRREDNRGGPRADKRGEEENWNRRFGHEVVGGMLDVEARTMRNPPHEQFEQQKAKVIQFGEMWAKFDWTRMYKKGNQGSDSDSD